MKEANDIYRLSGGETVFASEWLPDGEAKGVFFCLHGVESHSEWFGEVAPLLAEKGWAVCACDRPGWGRSAGEKGHLSSYEKALSFVTEIGAKLRSRFCSVHLTGLSWGGLLAMYSALRRGMFFDSVTLIAPGIIPLVDISLAQKARVTYGVLSGKHSQIPIPINPAHFTTRTDRTEFILKDQWRTTSVSSSFCLETLKMRKFVQEKTGARKTPPLQVLLAGNDEIIDNAATEKLAEKCGAKVSVYENKAHSLVFEAPEKVADDLLSLASSVACCAAENSAEKSAQVMLSHNSDPALAENNSDKPRVAVVGAGAVGSMVGALLANGGADVTLVAREKHVRAVNENGLALELAGTCAYIKKNLIAVENVADISGKADLVLLAMKSFDTEKALSDMQPLVGDGTVILSLQNGLVNEPCIKARYPDNPVIAGAICAYLDFVEPGRVSWQNDIGGVAGACFSGDLQKARDAWLRIMPLSGLECPFYDFPEAATSVKWSKLMLNVAFNALNAVTGLPAGGILANREYGLLAARALREGFAVMNKLNIRPVDLPGYSVSMLSKATRLPPRMLRLLMAWKTAGDKAGRSSMAQDLARGRAVTEIDEINGAVVRAAGECSLATPANEELCEMVRKAAQR